MQFDINNMEKLSIGLLIAVIFVIGFNAFQISQLRSIEMTASAGKSVIKNTAPLEAMQTVSQKSDSSSLDVIPKGIPNIYGNELRVSYDDVSSTDQKKADSTIKKLGVLDEQIKLSGIDLKRYIDVASKMSCEYCCGVDSIIFSDGKPACSCAHSFAMRGLAKYLIKNHGNEFTNEQILEELGKWKTLFFPAQMGKKAMVLKEKGIEINYINLASNKYRGVENGN